MPASMPSRRLSPVHWFTSAVSLAGIAVAVLVLAVDHDLVRHGALLTAALLVPGVIVGELLPLKIPRRGDDEEITVSTTFAFALLLSAGLGAAILAQAVASVVQDVAARKPAWRIAFNVGQYTLALAAAGAVLSIGSPAQGLHVPIEADQLPLVTTSAAAFFVTNFLVVGVAIALFQRMSVLRYVRNDFIFSLYVGAVLLSLGPVLLAAIEVTPALYPACLLVMAAIYQGGRQAARAERQATHDALTGLANRARLQAVIRWTIDEHADQRPFAVLLMDLDRFKEINDTLGHHHGDLLLKRVGARLEEVVRPGDVVGRLGGDEFVVVLRDLPDEAAAVEVAERIDRALRVPFAVDDLAIEAGVSIGIATFPREGTDVAALLRHADIAMYHAKRNHLAYAIYDPQHDHHSPAQLALAADLRRALDGDEIEPYYQLQVDLADGSVPSVEALARWRHPTLGLLGPAAFVELAEGTGLIRALTLEVLDRALRDRLRWLEAGIDVAVAVNVSVRTLLDRSFPAAVAGCLAANGTDPRRLKLEITEGTIMADPAVATSVLRELDAMGVTLSIDDYGTGYSSLAYLRELPVLELKIDRSFIARMVADESSALIVRSTIELGHNLGLRVIAEGVEDPQTLERLRLLRCDGAQGFLLSHPLPAADVAARIGRPEAPATAVRLLREVV
jgi:diguanylate cyclase (GGDEF)-like protein